MNVFSQISQRIIQEQALIIGPIAWEEAQKVPGLQVVNAAKAELQILGDGRETVDKLVKQYERLFGKASQEVCKDAVRDLIATLTKEEIPSSLV